MKILVFSDSHGKTALMHHIIQSSSCDIIFHLGDCYDDMVEISNCYDIPTFGVIGNVDYSSDGPIHERLSIENTQFFLTHGHHYHVKQHLNHIRDVAKQVSADIVLFGHTHMPVIEENGFLLMNPGSISRPRNGYPSYGVITLEDNHVRGDIIYVK